jgi:hypothetical protein
VYRTVGGVTQGKINTSNITTGCFNDQGATGTTACPDSPAYSPITNSLPVNGTIDGQPTRKYAVVAVIGGVRRAHYDVVTETLGSGTLSSTQYTLIAWPRVYGQALVSEVYEIYRTAGNTSGKGNGTSTGLIGTVDRVDRFRDTGQVATTATPEIPATTRNQKVTINDCDCTHREALGTNNQYGLQINSCENLVINNSHFSGHWLDGVKARARVYSVRWHGGSANT